ncbi:predicted protein [Coccidioides posadasii str. Silveira]|uniref:Predicted protein n=1 Tax=Coccidioides posadasii (strain RMSCC 757 / Silveira) TaxID=443226 RepID=E9CWG2_COCPS|nr:predicted protein [Coccidioides posadasii str. Silveira]
MVCFCQQPVSKDLQVTPRRATFPEIIGTHQLTLSSSPPGRNLSMSTKEKLRVCQIFSRSQNFRTGKPLQRIFIAELTTKEATRNQNGPLSTQGWKIMAPPGGTVFKRKCKEFYRVVIQLDLEFWL